MPPPPITDRPIYQAISKVAGAILIVVSLLKFFSTTAPETTGITSLIPSWSLALVPVYEFGLGIWLISGIMIYGSWLTLISTLGLFILHNIQLVTTGRSTCGCLGAVTVLPEVMLLADIMALLVVLKRRPAWSGWPAATLGLRRFCQTIAVIASVLALVVVGVYTQYGSITVALADSRGDPLAIVGQELDLGTRDPGEVAEQSIIIVNLTNQPIQIAMAESRCRCATFPELPVTIPAGERFAMPVKVRVSEEAGSFRRAARFRTTAGDLYFSIGGWVRNTTKTFEQP
jgi:hypothetical protein